MKKDEMIGVVTNLLLTTQKQETAREIIATIIDDNGADLNKIARKYGIELED